MNNFHDRVRSRQIIYCEAFVNIFTELEPKNKVEKELYTNSAWLRALAPGSYAMVKEQLAEDT